MLLMRQNSENRVTRPSPNPTHPPTQLRHSSGRSEYVSCPMQGHAYRVLHDDDDADTSMTYDRDSEVMPLASKERRGSSILSLVKAFVGFW